LSEPIYRIRRAGSEWFNSWSDLFARSRRVPAGGFAKWHALTFNLLPAFPAEGSCPSDLRSFDVPADFVWLPA
jgi:hypothetical protein